MDEKTFGQIACDAFSNALLNVPMGGLINSLSSQWSQYSDIGKGAWESAAVAVRSGVFAEVEHVLASPILGITLGPDIEGKITESEALALVNASRVCLLAGVQAMRGKRDG